MALPGVYNRPSLQNRAPSSGPANENDFEYSKVKDTASAFAKIDDGNGMLTRQELDSDKSGNEYIAKMREYMNQHPQSSKGLPLRKAGSIIAEYEHQKGNITESEMKAFTNLFIFDFVESKGIDKVNPDPDSGITIFRGPKIVPPLPE